MEPACKMNTTGTREEWLAAELDLLRGENEPTHRGDELARRRTSPGANLQMLTLDSVSLTFLTLRSADSKRRFRSLSIISLK